MPSRRRLTALVAFLLACTPLAAQPFAADPATAEIIGLLGDGAAERAGAPPRGRVMARALREVDVTADRVTTRYQVDFLRAVSFPVFFGGEGRALSDESRAQLRALGRALSAPELAGERFLVAGHADTGASESRNLELSYERARAVRDYLVEAFRIDPRRLVVAGWGSARPVEGQPPRSGSHRRIEVALVLRTLGSQPAARFVRRGASALDDLPIATIDPVGDPRAFEAGLRVLAVRPAPEGCVQPTHDLDDFQPGGPIVGCIPVRPRR
ncbi:OmpA family protein [Salinarimonas soli]|uniref:OmpA family protein n=1 Tax=Salinarimonas soli TaxID=1638099 RepID=A0A5B2V7Y1_9HYPH|nr:OmpA family protein [Salinarimonas soli]KAA2235071.1 OmpA family protein [Salinarimonas soli]